MSVRLVLPLTVLAFFAPLARSSSDSLTFFNNWFVTGDYSVAGVGLRGLGAAKGAAGVATGKINMTGVPSGALPIAAFLYWSTSEPSSTPSASLGSFNGNKIQGAVLGSAASPNPGCSASGSTAGYGFVYRADVLRYLPVDSNNNPLANGNQTVGLPDSVAGTGGTIYTNGASLVVIYKIVVPGLPTVAPLRSVVIYNGAFTMNKQTSGFSQNVAGFYQASADADARMTSIVANGQQGFVTPLSVNGNTLDTNPFVGAQGTQWDNPSFNINLATNASSFSTTATASSSKACVTFAAIVASTNVQDSDNDGLLDIWETQGLHRNTAVFPATFGTCAQYPSEPCVNLPQMGANPNKKDIFVQIDWMNGTGGGGGIDGNGTHDHKPLLAALNTVAGVFATNGINLHFDVGPNYQGNQATCGNAPCPFIVPSAYASGGSDMPETLLECSPAQQQTTHPCNYPGLPVLSFEYGFASVRDGNSLLGISAHFAQNRKDIFHYALFAHALAGPFNAAGQPIDPFSLQPLPSPATPYSYSGIAHRPGGGFMVTLGLWRSDIPAYDMVGSAQEQAGTLMHELGHNLGLGHAGLATQPNCLPNYPSVMNYLYQTRGLTDASGAEHVDYSYGTLLPLSEDYLTTSIPMAALPGLQRYRVRYYGPLAPGQPSSQAAQLHCNGTPITGGQAEVRLEGPAVSTPDWSNGNVPLGKVSPPLDVNYDGTIGQLFFDQPDWLVLNLQQIGTGYTFGGLSVGAFATDGGAYATDGGALATDAGALATDGGAFATDGGAFATDGGAFATDGGAFATDGGALATDGGALATDAGEIDENTVLLSSVDPPSSLTAVNTGTGITLTWTPPSVGQVVNYNIYRCAVIYPATSCAPAGPVFNSSVKGLGYGGPPTPTFTDTVNDLTDSGEGGIATCNTKTCYNTTYYYYVTAVVTALSKNVESANSNTVNTEVPHLFVIANAPVPASIVYGTANPALSFTVYGDVASSLSSSAVNCVYVTTNNTPRNVGTYTISCSGPATTSATNGVTYNAPYLSYVPPTLTITQRPITVTAASSSKVYDGTTSSSAVPTLTSGTLASWDSASYSETYDNPYVNGGAAHTMTPAVMISDGNGANDDYTNYLVTLVTSTTGLITPAPASVTPNPATKVYGTPDPSPLTTGTLTGFVPADGVTATYARTAGEAVLGSPYTISATLSPTGVLSNYKITYNTASFTITPAPLIVTVTGSQIYGGGSPTFSIASYAGLAGTDTFSGATANSTLSCIPPVATTGVGTYLLGTGWSCGGLNSQNYAISYTGTFTVNPAPLMVTVAGTQSYGSTTPSFVVNSYSGLVNGETNSVVSGAITSCTTTSPVTGPGNYTISGCTGLSAANYTITYNGTLTVSVAGLTSFVLNGTAVPMILTSPGGLPELQLTQNMGSETASAWYPYEVPVAGGFSTTFQFQILPASGQTLADGFAFVIQFGGYGGTSGTSLLGQTGAGGYIGYTGITNSLAVEFDTYQNTDYGDPASPHIGIQSNGTAANSPIHYTINPDGSRSAGLANLGGPVVPTQNFADGNQHTATITYNPPTLSVYLDGATTPIVSATVNLSTLLNLDGGANAYVGFTAATGASMEFSDIQSFTWTPGTPQ